MGNMQSIVIERRPEYSEFMKQVQTQAPSYIDSKICRSPASIEVPPTNVGTFRGAAAPVVDEALEPVLVDVELPGFDCDPAHVTAPLTTWLL